MRDSTRVWSRSAQHEMPARTVGSRYASGRAQYAAKKPSWQSAGIGTVSTRMPPSTSSTSAKLGPRTCSSVSASGRYSSVSQKAPWTAGIPGEHHEPSGDALHLGQAGPPVGPVVDREDGERGVERCRAEGEVLRDAPHRRRGAL